MQAGSAADVQPRFGAKLVEGGVRFAVWSGAAERLWLSLFDADGERETDRLELAQEGDGVHALTVPGLGAGARYGFRADGEFSPRRGCWFDPDKLLLDPYAVAIDRPFQWSAALAARRGEGPDTASLVPKAIVAARLPALEPGPVVFRPGSLIYEVPVKAFSKLHPDVPEAQRGTVAALAHPAVIAHLQKLRVSAVELMPVTAAIDERHLVPLGLTNAWGYNPVAFMALEPRLAPGGIAELRATTAALHEAGIGVILDLVFNHTGESDQRGPTLSLRGLDNRAYYRHAPGEPARLVNDTGTGNTLACDHPVVRQLILDSLRHFVLQAGIDGFRFDLAPILGRSKAGFDPHAALLTAMAEDPVLNGRMMIAEPWDLGSNGYQLGNFPAGFLEWNDKSRDDLRRFWRGDRGMVGALATRLAGSSDVFAQRGARETRTVNFVAAHDGMTLADLTRYERKHNEANGEKNHDGHNENFSWNNGVEGASGDIRVIHQRERDARALLATLFASRGTIMLTAGDEFGRSQGGNNNAYAQDNSVTWLDWQGRDGALEDYVAALAAMRAAAPAFGQVTFLAGQPREDGVSDVEWLSETGEAFTQQHWHDPRRHRIAMLLGGGTRDGGRLAVLVNGDRRASTFVLPERQGFDWEILGIDHQVGAGGLPIPGRTVIFAIEHRSSAG